MTVGQFQGLWQAKYADAQMERYRGEAIYWPVFAFLGLLAGLDTPSSGKVVIAGVDITGLSEDKLALVRGEKIGFVFQSYQLIPTLTAEENVLLPHELAGRDVRSGTERARELLKSVGLEDRMDHYPVQLSGGEQQRVALARAFMMKPPILMADEPTGNLDSVNGAHVLELLISLNEREGLAAAAGPSLIVPDPTRRIRPCSPTSLGVF